MTKPILREHHTQQLNVRITEADYAVLSALADESESTPSQAARLLLLKSIRALKAEDSTGALK